MNQLIQLPEEDKNEIELRAKKASLSVYDAIDGSVSPEIVKRLLEVMESGLKRELGIDRFKILRKELEILSLKEDIENLKRQIK